MAWVLCREPRYPLSPVQQHPAVDPSISQEVKAPLRETHYIRSSSLANIDIVLRSTPTIKSSPSLTRLHRSSLFSPPGPPDEKSARLPPDEEANGVMSPRHDVTAHVRDILSRCIAGQQPYGWSIWRGGSGGLSPSFSSRFETSTSTNSPRLSRESFPRRAQRLSPTQTPRLQGRSSLRAHRPSRPSVFQTSRKETMGTRLGGHNVGGDGRPVNKLHSAT